MHILTRYVCHTDTLLKLVDTLCEHYPLLCIVEYSHVMVHWAPITVILFPTISYSIHMRTYICTYIHQV